MTENPFFALIDTASYIADFMTDPTDAHIDLKGTNTPTVDVHYLNGNDTAAATLASDLGFTGSRHVRVLPEYAHLNWHGKFLDVSVRVTVLVPTVVWLRRTVDGFDQLPEQERPAEQVAELDAEEVAHAATLARVRAENAVEDRNDLMVLRASNPIVCG